MRGYPRFTSVEGTAESTRLPDHSIDLITAGQAFHWFDPLATRTEFQRILKHDGWVALIWNKRPEGEFHVLDAYSELLHRYSPEYDLVRHRDDAAEAGMSVLFGDNGYREFSLPHLQAMTYDAFWGRLLSSSYTPLPGQPGHDEIRNGSKEIFDAIRSRWRARIPVRNAGIHRTTGAGKRRSLKQLRRIDRLAQHENAVSCQGGGRRAYDGQDAIQRSSEHAWSALGSLRKPESPNRITRLQPGHRVRAGSPRTPAHPY